jgi:hypothetical protein
LRTPTRYHYEGNPHSYWKAFEDGGWIVDENAQVTCENDVSIYLDHPGVDFDRLSGFYVQRQAPTDNPSGYKATLYTQIKTVDVPHLLYLFKHNDQWMIGESYGNDGMFSLLWFCKLPLIFYDSNSPIASFVRES